MSAQIRISVERGGVIISTNVNQSVDNVRKGDVVYCESVDVHTTYSWTLVFTPDSPNGTVSSSGLINPPGSTVNNCKFVVDNEGAYLVRLVVDAGLGTESTQFLRIRKITRFGDLKLVAAGERKDSVGAIPFDIDPVGWADDQNQNLQKLLAYVRRLSVSGRVLYVDANRGRKAYDSTQNANDFTNTLEMPGADLSALTVSGVVTDAEGFADFSDLSSAITYAGNCASRGETALSSDHPYVILVQNGLYIEDVNLAPNIHIVSADNFFTTDNTYAKGVVIRSTNVTGGHTFVGTNNTDSVVCVGVEFENTDGASTNPAFKVQKGIAHFVNCTISQKSGTGGSALSIIPVDHTTTDECQAHLMNSYVQNTVVSSTDYAIKCGSDNARLVIENSTVVGQNGIQCNADYGGGLKENVHFHIVRSTVMANNVNGYAIISNASDLQVSHSYVSSSDTTRVLVIGENLPKTGDIVAKLIFSEFSNAQISFDTRQIAGSKTLQTSSCIYSEYVFPDAPPTHNAETQAKSLKYENNYADPFNSGTLAVPVPNQLGATDVQDALDDLTFLSAILGAFGTFNSLDVAYDGVISVNPPTLGSGSGRKIAADQGAVVIQSAVAPYVTTPISGTETTPLTSADKNGYLQVEGNLEVGKVDSAEIEFITNYGTIGSMLSLGSVTWNSEIASVASGVDHRSLPSAILQGNSDKDGLLHNYNLRLQTKSTKSVSNGSVGWVVLQGGDSLDKGPSVPGPHAGDVYIQGGSYLGTASSIGDNCPAGNVYLIPGTSTGVGSDEPYGYVKLINPSASTSATLVASSPCSSPTTVAGEISWATPMGVVTATITIGMTVADVVNAINNATVGAGLIFAQDTAGVISLSCVSKGELSDVVYVGDNDSGNLNTDLGDFQISSGAIFSAGTDSQYVNIHSSAMHEITIGEGGAVGSMIYNSETGKLTVPGLIDPTGMIFSEENQSNVPTGANEGAIFVSDGSGGLIANKIYYKPANNGTPVDLTAGGGGGGLTNWSEDGSGNLYPNTTSTQNLGTTTNVIQNLYLKDDSGITFTDGTTNSTLDVLDVSGTPVLQFNGVSLLTTTVVSSKIELSDLSVNTNAASGSGALSYDNTTGVFDFTPADVSGGGSAFTNWSEDGAYNWVTNATKNIGSPNQHIGNIYMDISDSSTRSLYWTKSSTSTEIWGISPSTTTASGGSANPNALIINTKNDVAETSVGDGINVQQRYTSFTNLIFSISEQKTVFTDTTNVTSTGTDYSTAQEFWVAENVTLTKYLTLDGASTSVIFNKVPTLYKDTTGNLSSYSNLVDGMIAYDTTTNNFVGYSGGSWSNLSGGGGGLTGSGNTSELAIFDSSGGVQGNSQLTFDGANHTLFLDSTNGNQGTYTHFANSGDNTANWLVGRSENGEFYIRTQTSHSTDGVGSLSTGTYNKGWRITTGGDIVPTASLKIGLFGDEVGTVHTTGVSGGNTGIAFYSDIGGSETLCWQIANTGNLLPMDPNGSNISPYSIGTANYRVSDIWCDTLHANSSSIHFMFDDGSGNTGNGGNEYDFALGVNTTDLTKPKLTFNGATIGGDYAVVSQHSVTTKYGSATNPLIYKVTVDNKTQNHPYDGVSGGSPSAYFLDGIESPAIRFSGADNGTSGSYYYRFDQSDNSNSGHPLRFYLSADKTTAYTTGVSIVGTAGQAGSYVQIEVNEDTPNILYYQCSAHSLMGNHATTISNTFNNSGTLVTVDDLVAGGGGATDKIEEGNTSVEVADSGSNGVIIFETEGSEKWRIRTAGHLVPQGTTGTLNIGQSDQRVDEIYSQSSMFHYQDLSFNSLYTELSCGGIGDLLGRLAQVRNNGSIEVLATHNDTLSTFGSATFFDNHIIPTADTTYDLGSATNKWRDLYLDGNTIYIGDSTLSLNIVDPADKFLEIDNVRIPTKFSDLADVDDAKTATTGHVLKRKADGRFAFEAETAGSVGNRIESGDSSLRIADGGTGATANLKLDNVTLLNFTSFAIAPATTDTYDLGSSTRTFAQTHTMELEIYQNGSTTPSGTIAASAADTIGTDAQVFVTKDHRYTQQTNHSTGQSEFRGIAERTTRMGNQSRIVHNTDVNTWKTNATDNARNGIIVPMFALATERVKTLSVQKGIWTKEGQTFRHRFFRRNGQTESASGHQHINEDYYRLDWPEYTLTDFSSTAEQAFGWTANTKQNSASCGFLGQLERIDEIQTLQFQEFLDENVRGFGHAHLFDGDSNPGSSVLSFIVNMKGIERIDIKILASKCSFVSGNSNWKDAVIAEETFNFAGAQVNTGFEGVLTVDNEEPVRLENISDRYGQVTVEIKIYLRYQAADAGEFLNRTVDHFIYSDLRLNLFSS